MHKPTLPKGTRDFGPVQMFKRNYLIDNIKIVFQKYGYLPLETPSMENLSVLTGKYGEEGDKLLYRILNSGDFMKDVSPDDFQQGSPAVMTKVAEKGLRYDLTVPFARYVVMNQHQINFPFRRYQIQPVWRADRPQKGRYREFYQCDADVVGTDSLICEAEIISIIEEVFKKLGLDQFTININNRKILTGITEVMDAPGKEADFCIAIDKLDKIGREKVEEELKERGFSQEAISKMAPVFEISGSNQEKLDTLKSFLHESEAGKQGIAELEEVFNLLKAMKVSSPNLNFDVTLARGLSYYTGAIFEVKMLNVQIGSVGGGGRYDNLTGVFGLPGLSGIGFSFGIDRLYDVLEALDLFPAEEGAATRLLITQFDRSTQIQGLSILQQVREAGISCEIFPDMTKLKKQLNYANKNNVPYVLVIGEEEMKSGRYALKDMKKGEQEQLNVEEIIEKLKNG
ncbi:MAG: histidine--tRNA ligase [Cyclobacteriaceae bacterium]